MGRLIDADALIEVLAKYKFGCLSHEVEREYIKETIIDFVKTEPTAYDVEKVCEELGKWSSEVQVVSEVNGKIHRVKVVNAERAINIAREGGVE